KLQHYPHDHTNHPSPIRTSTPPLTPCSPPPSLRSAPLLHASDLHPFQVARLRPSSTQPAAHARPAIRQPAPVLHAAGPCLRPTTSPLARGTPNLEAVALEPEGAVILMPPVMMIKERDFHAIRVWIRSPLSYPFRIVSLCHRL
ncbi:unnamed protein product, partial [Urochloa humidicola]